MSNCKCELFQRKPEGVVWISAEMQQSHSLDDASQVAQQVIHCLQILHQL